MRRTRRLRKTVALCAAGGMMLQFGGCNFFRVVARSIPVGIGQTLGAGLTLGVPIAVTVGSLQPLLDQFLGTTPAE